VFTAKVLTGAISAVGVSIKEVSSLIAKAKQGIKVTAAKNATIFYGSNCKKYQY
jgi:hypothetical protein